MFKKFLLIVLVALLSSCNLFRHVKPKTDIIMGSTMKDSFYFEATPAQIDSVCLADTLPTYNKWLVRRFEDFETGKFYDKYMFIKVFNNKKEVIYILLIDDAEPYPFEKRTVVR